MAAIKTPCRISREQFRQGAKPIRVTIGDVPVLADVKEFSTGSLGWYANGKISIEVGGQVVQVQLGLNLTIANSKELPQ